MTVMGHLPAALLLSTVLAATAFIGGDGLSVQLIPGGEPIDLAGMDPRSVQDAPRTLERLHQRFGRPTVIVRADRPAYPDDKGAATALVTELSKRGFDAKTEAAALVEVREEADKAKGGQVPDDVAKSALVLRPDFEVTVHAEKKTSDRLIYSNTERTVTKDLRCDIRWRGRDVKSCHRSVESRVLLISRSDTGPDDGMDGPARDIGPEVAAALVIEWIRVGEPAQPLRVEVQGGLPSDTSVPTGTKILKNTPGVSTELVVEGELSSSLRSIGPLLVDRPGFALIDGSKAAGWQDSRSGRWAWDTRLLRMPIFWAVVAVVLVPSGMLAANAIVRRGRGTSAMPTHPPRRPR